MSSKKCRVEKVLVRNNFYLMMEKVNGSPYSKVMSVISEKQRGQALVCMTFSLGSVYFTE
jgi:hypothetical protein